MFKILVVLSLYLSCFTHVFCNTSNRRILPGSVKKLTNPSNFESLAINKTVVTLGDKRTIHGKKSLAVNQRIVLGSNVNAKTSPSNIVSKLTPKNKQTFSQIQANKKNSSIVVWTFNGTVGIESKPKNTSFIVGTQSKELSINKTVTSLGNTTVPPDKIPIKQTSKAKPNNYIDNVTIADIQIAVLPENERIIHGSNSKPELIPSIVPKADNKTAKLPGNKLVIHGSEKKAKFRPSAVLKPDNNTAKLPGNKRIIDGSKKMPKLFPFIEPKMNNNTDRLPENKKMIDGSKTTPKLILSTVPEPDNKKMIDGSKATQILIPSIIPKLDNKKMIDGSKTTPKLILSTVPEPDNKKIIHGSRTTPKLIPSTVPKPDNKKMIDGSKTTPKLIQSTVPKPDSKNIIDGSKATSILIPSTVPEPDNKKIIHGSRTTPKLIPSTVPEPDNKKIIHGSRTTPKLIPSTVPKPDKKKMIYGSKTTPILIPSTVPEPDNKKMIDGSKTTPKLIPSTVPEPDNKKMIDGSKTTPKLIPSTVPEPDNKKIIDGSKTTPKLIPSTVPEPDNKKMIDGSKTTPILMPSVVSEVNNKTKLPFKACNKTIKIVGHQRIVQGIEAKRQQFPFIVSIIDRKFFTHMCGGSIIDMYHILTAAHCCVTATQKTVDYHKIVIQAGDINIGKSKSGPNRIYRDPVEVIPHPWYNSITVENDICIIRYSNELVLSKDVEIIPLGISTPKPDEPCEIAGWGTMSESNKTQPLTLRTTNIRIIDRATCNGDKAYDGLVPRLTVCAGMHTASGVLSQDACQGDSGGPLVCNKTLNGVVSFGRGCGDSRFPGVYTDVSQFRTWIESVLNRTHNHDLMLKSKLSFTLLMAMTTVLNLVVLLNI